MKQTLCGYVQKLLQAVEDGIYPQEMVCVYCKRLSDAGALCHDCREALREDVMDNSTIAPGVQAVWKHQGVARRLVLTMKHSQKAICAKILAEGMAKQLLEGGQSLSPEMVVTSVPMTTSARKKRGMDHGALLAQEVAKALQLPYRTLLYRVRETSVQKRLSAQERRKNMKGAFVACESITFPVLLVDDVYTTGATAEACRKALRDGGAKEICVITATHTIDRAADGGPKITDDMLAGEPLVQENNLE